MKTARALGIDFGEARIGVAVSDELGMMAHPLETIPAKQGDPIARILALAKEKNAGTVIVGLPLNMDGTKGSSAEKARAFAEKISGASGGTLSVHLWDERMTTLEASRSLREAGRSARQQKSAIDQAAAQCILQGWLDRQALLQMPVDGEIG